MNVSHWSHNFSRLAGLALLGFASLTSTAVGNNVKVFLEGELLVVEGDNNANQITITNTAQGDVSVFGRNGTRINGIASVIFRGAVINAVEIKMNGGNDNVVVNNMIVLNDLYADLGAGNDSLISGALPSTIGANAMIQGGLGHDNVRLTGWQIGGDLFLDGQVGRLWTHLTGLNVGFALTVVGDATNDTVLCTNGTTGDVTSIETKGGADRITVTDHLAFGLMIQTDTGADTVALDGVSTLEDIGINSGTENDLVTFLDVQSGKNINVALDAGTDSFIGINVFAELDAVFNGGAGSDRFQNGGVAGGTKTEVLEFEIIE